MSLAEKVAAKFLRTAEYSSLEDVNKDIAKHYNGLVDTRNQIVEALKKLQQDDKKLLAAKAQKLQQSVEDIMARVESLFPHLVQFH